MKLSYIEANYNQKIGEHGIQTRETTILKKNKLYRSSFLPAAFFPSFLKIWITYLQDLKFNGYEFKW